MDDKTDLVSRFMRRQRSKSLSSTPVKPMIENIERGRTTERTNILRRSASPQKVTNTYTARPQRSPSPPREKTNKRSSSAPPTKRKKKKIGYIYMLHLRRGNYYIGYTTNPERRFSEHKAGAIGGGAAWSSKYKPISMEILKKNANTFEEDMYVKKVMAEKGIDRVRGGSYSSIWLPYYVKEQLKKEIYNATGKCFYCGKKGHFMSECRKRSNILL